MHNLRCLNFRLWTPCPTPANFCHTNLSSLHDNSHLHPFPHNDRPFTQPTPFRPKRQTLENEEKREKERKKSAPNSTTWEKKKILSPSSSPRPRRPGKAELRSRSQMCGAALQGLPGWQTPWELLCQVVSLYRKGSLQSRGRAYLIHVIAVSWRGTCVSWLCLKKPHRSSFLFF